MVEPTPADPHSIEALSHTVTRLRAERDGLRNALRDRAVIEQAKGILTERLAIAPEEAFDRLVTLSTRNNVKVSRLAATLVSRQVPEPPEVAALTLPDLMDRIDHQDAVPQAGAVGLPADAETLATEVRLLTARIHAATSFTEIAETLATATAGWLAPANVILLLLEPDGALSLVGSAGLSMTTSSQWDRVPPIGDSPIIAAVRERTPVHIEDAEAASPQLSVVVADPPLEELVALPLVQDDSVLGVVELTWAASSMMDKGARERLYTLAAPCAQRCAELCSKSLSTKSGSETQLIDTTVLQLLLEALSEPAVLLTPRIDDDSRIVDFHIDGRSPAAQRQAVVERASGSSDNLLTILPQVGSSQLLPLLTQVLRTGEPSSLHNVYIDAATEGAGTDQLIDVHATRLWDRVLMTWRAHSRADLLYEQFLLTERTYHSGTARWNLNTGETRWSPGMFQLIGANPADGPMGVDHLAQLIHPHDRDMLATLAADRLRAQEELSMTLRGHGSLAGQRFQLTATSVLDSDGAVTEILGCCRDITAATG